MIEHVQFCHHQPFRAIDPVGVAKQGDIQPAASTRPSRYRAVFLAAVAKRIAGGIEISVGNGPSPTLVTYAFVTPITVPIFVGPTPVPVTAPPAVADEDVTKGYVP